MVPFMIMMASSSSSSTLDYLIRPRVISAARALEKTSFDARSAAKLLVISVVAQFCLYDEAAVG